MVKPFSRSSSQAIELSRGKFAGSYKKKEPFFKKKTLILALSLSFFAGAYTNDSLKSAAKAPFTPTLPLPLPIKLSSRKKGK